MAFVGLNTGSSPNSGDGDSLLQGAIKINSAFNELYTALGDGSNLQITSDKVSEGNSNLYFTNERAQDAIGEAINNGTKTGISVTYDDAANKINFSNYTITTTSTGKTLSNLEYCTTTANNISLVLPASPSVGNRVIIGIGGNFANIKIERNGSNIMGIAEDMTIDFPYITLDLIYINSALGWRIS